MNMVKQIYASLEISEREVRILVGEYFNTRFNIIKLAKVPCEGVANFKIIDKEKVKTAIKECVNEVEDKIGTKLEKVILIIPSDKFRRVPLKISVVPSDTGFCNDDVVRALNKTLDVDVEENLLVINRLPIKYTINGISSRRMPENEVCDEVLVDVDLLCAEKKTAYDYVSVVETCGIQVLDICLNTYAICKEAVLIEQSLNSNIVLLDINNSYTGLSLISKGKLLSTEIMNSGIGNFVQALYSSYQLPYKTLSRLIKYNGSVDEKSDDIIFAYSDNDVNIDITLNQLNSLIRNPVKKYIREIVTMSRPIIDSGQTQFVIVGDGADMNMLYEELKKQTKCDVKVYHPDTLGVRESGLIGLFGSFFVMKEIANLRNMKVACVDLKEFDKVVDREKADLEGESLTSKIKSLFKQNTNKGE